MFSSVEDAKVENVTVDLYTILKCHKEFDTNRKGYNELSPQEICKGYLFELERDGDVSVVIAPEERDCSHSVLHYRNLTCSNNMFSSYVQSIKLISTRSTNQWENNKTINLYSEGASLSNFIHEGRPTTTKRTFVVSPAILSSTNVLEVYFANHNIP